MKEVQEEEEEEEGLAFSVDIDGERVRPSSSSRSWGLFTSMSRFCSGFCRSSGASRICCRSN